MTTKLTEGEKLLGVLGGGLLGGRRPLIQADQTILTRLSLKRTDLASHVNKRDISEMSMFSDVTVKLFIFADENYFRLQTRGNEIFLPIHVVAVRNTLFVSRCVTLPTLVPVVP